MIGDGSFVLPSFARGKDVVDIPHSAKVLARSAFSLGDRDGLLCSVFASMRDEDGKR